MGYHFASVKPTSPDNFAIGFGSTYYPRPFRQECLPNTFPHRWRLSVGLCKYNEPSRYGSSQQSRSYPANTTAAQPLKLEKTTRLQFNWLLGPAVSAENFKPISDMQSGIDLGGVYSISLLRLFLPQPTEFVLVPNFDSVYLQWWMSNCLKKIPTSRFIYDTIVGKSGFGVGCCGGSFRFDEFLKAAFPTNSAAAPPSLLIHSFDLAPLAQLACSLLVDENGDEKLNSKWVCKSPFGVQKPGVPFGVTDKTVPAVSWLEGVNNPYFSGEGERTTNTIR